MARGFETHTFEEALALEPQRLHGETEQMLATDAYYSFAHQHFSYRAKGVYVDQLARWFEHFPREQLLVVKSEDLYAEPTRTTRRVTAFLGLPDWEPTDRRVHHQRTRSEMNAAIQRGLAAFYAPHNRRLYDVLGVDLGWSA